VDIGRTIRWFVTPVTAAAVMACDIVSVACTGEARAGIVVIPVDSVSLSPVTNALIWAREGAYVDTLRAFDPSGRAAGAYERAGHYEVHILATGYASWTASGIRVDEDQCHVKTVELLARLRPQ
jgi:hypothetical protein